MKIGHLSVIYGLVAILAVLLLLFYMLWERKKTHHFLFLFTCVAAVNIGYFMLSIAKTLTGALIANAVSYFGAAYSLLAMVWIIGSVCQVQKIRWASYLLCAISTAAFLLAASGPWLGLYYQSAELTITDGVSHLSKVYGPLHILYTVYLAAYVLLMIGLIIHAARKNRLSSLKYALLLIAAVLLNVAVWAVEQAITESFEFLSVSYVVTEVMLLLIYGLLRDYGIIQPGGKLLSIQTLTTLNARKQAAGELPPGMEELFQSFTEKVQTLSSAERRILNYYMDGHEISEIPDLAYISIHTVKKHNRSIYQKLEVASRDELMLYFELFRCCDRLEDIK